MTSPTRGPAAPGTVAPGTGAPSAPTQGGAPIRSLSGKTALVTGAGGGIGRGIALALAAAGANVAIAVRRQTTGDETASVARAEGGRVLVVEADVSVQAQVQRAVAATADEFGGLDIVVHN